MIPRLANNSMERMNASRLAQLQFLAHGRLDSTAHAGRSTNHRQPEAIKGAT
jgi:hypothetical protein